METIEIKNLTQKYLYGAVGIKGLSLKASKGEVIGIFGESESGKTSLVKCIAGLFPCCQGEALADGKDILKLPVKDRNVAVLYQENSLFQYHSVRYNLAYPLKIRKIDKPCISNSVNEVLDRFGLVKDADTRINKLNRITKLKTLFARLFVRQADLYLLDNPFYDFIREERISAYEAFKERIIELSRNAVTFFATDKTEETLICDRICVLNYGIPLQVGTYEEIINHPATLFVRKKFNEDKGLITTESVLQMDKDSGNYYIGNNNRVYLYKEAALQQYLNKTVYATYFVKNAIIDVDSVMLFDWNNETLIYS